MERLKVNEYLGSWHKDLPLAIKESFTDEDGLKVVAEQTFIGSELSKKCPVHEVSSRDVVERSKIDKAINKIEDLEPEYDRNTYYGAINDVLKILKEI